MLKTCFSKLEARMKEHRFNALKQGDDDRQTLLNKFKATNNSVLFGTDSFWEGVDVAGDALRCVIIVKLPFRVPSDPLIQARSEAISAKGGDPFMDYSLPQAIVKFKQGFGRLIRNRRDRGCIICLDTRILSKRYGKLFLTSLPNCKQSFAPNKDLQIEIKEFYRKTHFLTKDPSLISK
jgi:ATP-dependent DNA helicase DinG